MHSVEPMVRLGLDRQHENLGGNPLVSIPEAANLATVRNIRRRLVTFFGHCLYGTASTFTSSESSREKENRVETSAIFGCMTSLSVRYFEVVIDCIITNSISKTVCIASLVFVQIKCTSLYDLSLAKA